MIGVHADGVPETFHVKHLPPDFEAHASSVGISLAPDAVRALELYCSLLVFRGSRLNLVSAGDRGRIPSRHFLDTLRAIPAMELVEDARVLDVGAGAGLVGVVVKIARPGLSLSLLESRGRKAGFLREVVRELRLEDVEVLPERLENVGRQDTPRTWDRIVSRAAGQPSALLADCRRVLAPGGLWVSWSPMQSLAGDPNEGWLPPIPLAPVGEAPPSQLLRFRRD